MNRIVDVPHRGNPEGALADVDRARNVGADEQIADAWRQAQVGATAALAAVTDAVGVRYRAAYQDDDAIILVFQRGNGRCLDLARRPGGSNSVKARDC